MIRRMLSAVLLLGFLVVASGCPKPEPTRNDMPIKASEGVDRKGKKNKSMEASLEEPPRK